MADPSTKRVVVSELPEVEELSTWLPHALVAVLGITWAVWFSRLAVESWSGFGFGVFDLGIFDQGTWLLSRGIEPFVTLRGLHLFGDHSSYILVLIAPLYRIWPDINLLVILAAVVPAVATWIVFRIGLAEGLRTWTAAAIAIVVLLQPAMAWVPWDSFHPETLAIVLIPAAYLSARRERPWLFVLFGVLILLVKEDAFLVVVPLAAYVWWRWKGMRMTAVGVVLLSAGIAVLNFGVVLPSLSPTGELIYTGRYTWRLEEILTSGRLRYLAGMLLPIPIVFRAPLVLAVGIPITAANLGSLFPYQQEIRWHYTAYLLGVLAIAAPIGMAKIVEGWGPDIGMGVISSRRRISIPFTIPLVAIALTGLLILGPDLTHVGVWQGSSGARQKAVHEAFDLIPDDAVVAASHTFAPHLAHRTEIYMLPNPWVDDVWGVSEGVPPSRDPSVVEWMAVNLDSAGETELGIVDSARDDGWIEVVGGVDFILLRAPPR